MSVDSHTQPRGAPAHRPVSRISMSLPEGLLDELDRMVAERGFFSRSQAIGEMLQRSLLEHKRERGEDVMVGTVTLVYHNGVRGLQQELAELQRRHIDEVISSLHVHLMHRQTMEVILVQGPVRTLERFADALRCRRGVICAKMHLIAALIPQLHPFTGTAGTAGTAGVAETAGVAGTAGVAETAGTAAGAPDAQRVWPPSGEGSARGSNGARPATSRRNGTAAGSTDAPSSSA